MTTALMAVNAGSPWKTLEDFLSHAKKNPGKVTCGTSGVEISGHFNLELLNVAAGVQISHVPYKAGSPANIAALLGGHIDCASQMIWPIVSSHVRAGKLRVLAVTRPLKESPQVPTFAKSGYSQVSLEVWFAFFAAANLPADVAGKPAPAFARAIKDPESVAKLEKAGFTVAYEDPKELSERIKKEHALVLALVLGPMLEENLRQSLINSEGSFLLFFIRPLSSVFLLISLVAVLFSLFRLQPSALRNGAAFD